MNGYPTPPGPIAGSPAASPPEALLAVDRAMAAVRAALSDITPTELARRAGVSDKTVAGARSPDWNPRARTLRRILQALPSQTAAGADIPKPAEM